MAESVPRSLRPPVALALAKAMEAISPTGTLPGDLAFEPKWDARNVPCWGPKGCRCFPCKAEICPGILSA